MTTTYDTQENETAVTRIVKRRGLKFATTISMGELNNMDAEKRQGFWQIYQSFISIPFKGPHGVEIHIFHRKKQ